MKYNVNFKLTRNDDLRDDDESFFDKEHISSEIKSWLEDLDYEVNDIQINNGESKWVKKENYRLSVQCMTKDL